MFWSKKCVFYVNYQKMTKNLRLGRQKVKKMTFWGQKMVKNWKIDVLGSKNWKIDVFWSKIDKKWSKIDKIDEKMIKLIKKWSKIDKIDVLGSKMTVLGGSKWPFWLKNTKKWPPIRCFSLQNGVLFDPPPQSKPCLYPGNAKNAIFFPVLPPHFLLNRGTPKKSI